MEFLDLIGVTSSTQNINVAKKQNYRLNEKSARKKLFCLIVIISVILQNDS